ncbi:MAG: hypothetical protein JXB32_26270 [Deltaproteobacteria bacterium]|nr:hypothetical protein [Deltaproteobacteria bacterium]
MARLYRTRRSPKARYAFVVALLCLLGGSPGCPSGNGDDAAEAVDETCDDAWCNDYCEALGLCYTGCYRGTCGCGCADGGANAEVEAGDTGLDTT